jgi:hypothetical protein
VPPVISLVGSATLSFTVGDAYNELGATCSDSEDGAIAVPAPSFNPALNMNLAGTYVANYTCTDTGSLTDTATRTVYVNSPGGSTDLAFTEMTSTAIDFLYTVNTRFWAGMPDVNGDGCFDIFVGTHSDNIDSAMYLQDLVGGACQGTFTYLANANNYTQASPESPRITGRYAFGNWTGDSDGIWSFWGTDVDGAAAAIYEIDSSTTVGGTPVYQAKSALCNSTSRCWPIDSDGDGSIELVHSNRELDALREIKDVQTGTVIHAANNSAADYHHLVFDTNGDTYPDIVNVQAGSIWRYNSTTSAFDLIAGTHTANANATPNHTLALDYDNDGDTDFMTMDGSWLNDGIAQWHLHRNNGNGTFTEVTNGSGLDTMNFYNEDYWTIYANAFVSDMNLDGYPDILFAGSEYGRDLHIILNDGDGTFTKWDDQDFGGGGGSGGKSWVYGRDYDNDGDIDLVKADDATGSMRLWRNDISTNNNWLRIRAVGLGDNTDGLHTRIIIRNPANNAIVSHYEVQHQQGNAGLIPHIGVGTLSAVNVEVIWPHSGGTQTHTNVAVDQDIIVYRTGEIDTYTPGSAIPLTYTAAAPTVNTEITLVADSTVTATSSELVTFALPFAEGEVTSLDEINVSIGANEQAVYVEQGLTWWSDNSIRSATIQMQNVDMSGGDVTLTVTDAGFNVARLTEQPHANGWATAGANKNSLQFPRIFALHDKQYLADSGLIPPYDPAPDIQDSFETYQVAQFDNWAGGLDYSTSTAGNWLFDRSSSMFKAYMTTGRVEFLKEAFLSKQFYFTHVRNVGDPVAAAGGDGCFEYGGVACADGKYIAPQQAKLALGLVGDSSQWDNSLIVEMALQADIGWNQYGTRDAFDNENEGFTERGAGMAGLAELTAWEITGDATVLSHMNERIASLKDMQQTVKSWDTSNGWTPKSGGFTHNIDVHEGVHNEGSAIVGDTDARGFSAWMSENIADFLWQAYHVTGNTDAPEMLRLLANAVESYGFTSSYDTVSNSYSRKAAFTGQNRTQSCNTTGANTDHVYMASAYASDVQLADNDWWPYYSDNHNIETVLTLSAGYRFETDSDNKEELLARINEIQAGWINTNCAAVFSNVHRLFNWQHRSNSIRTAERIIREDV